MYFLTYDELKGLLEDRSPSRYYFKTMPEDYGRSLKMYICDSDLECAHNSDDEDRKSIRIFSNLEEYEKEFKILGNFEIFRDSSFIVSNFPTDLLMTANQSNANLKVPGILSMRLTLRLIRDSAIKDVLSQMYDSYREEEDPSHGRISFYSYVRYSANEHILKKNNTEYYKKLLSHINLVCRVPGLICQELRSLAPLEDTSHIYDITGDFYSWLQFKPGLVWETVQGVKKELGEKNRLYQRLAELVYKRNDKGRKKFEDSLAAFNQRLTDNQQTPLTAPSLKGPDVNWMYSEDPNLVQALILARIMSGPSWAYSLGVFEAQFGEVMDWSLMM